MNAFEEGLHHLEAVAKSPLDDFVVGVMFKSIPITTDEELTIAFDIVQDQRPSAATTIQDEYELLWQFKANCLDQDPDEFFPERGGDTLAAKAICAECVVRTDCLESALKRGEKFGIWGGLTERERTRIKLDRRLARRASDN